MAGCPQQDVDSMEGTVLFLLKILFLLLQAVRKRLGGTAFLSGSKTIIMTKVQTKMKVKQKQSLSRPARRELQLAQAKRGGK